jgi:hypothetical protein
MGWNLIHHNLLLFWDLSHYTGSTNEKVGTGPIFNIKTPFQRLKHIHIPYGKTISA